MTLSEAIEATKTGYVVRPGCLYCKFPVTEADPEGDWEPWTDIHETNAANLRKHIEQQLAAFTCPGCSA